jgi:hypothetical protein
MLLDTLELRGRDDRGEGLIFSGVVQDGTMLHALRLFRDRASSCVRVEASPLRGSMKDVPIWTAFVTRYAEDPDWVHYEGQGVVSVAAFRPPPYVFLLGYEPARNARGEYILQFATSDGT